jgi:hypothetical protein
MILEKCRFVRFGVQKVPGCPLLLRHFQAALHLRPQAGHLGPKDGKVRKAGQEMQKRGAGAAIGDEDGYL